MEEKAYKGTVVCTNCGYEGQLDIPKGQEVRNYLMEQPKRICSTCGCGTLTAKRYLAERRFV